VHEYYADIMVNIVYEKEALAAALVSIDKGRRGHFS
jgi:hypothetical protein